MSEKPLHWTSIFFSFLWKQTGVKFVVVGALNTMVGYLLFALLIFLNMHYVLACLLSTTLGIIFNFTTTGKFVFANNEKRLIIRFGSVYLLTYTLSVSLLKLMTSFESNMYLNGAVATVMMTPISYFLCKHIVFRERPI